MQKTAALALLGTLLVMGAAARPASAQQARQGDHPDIRLFLQATGQDATLAEDALRQIGAQWRLGYAGIIWDLARLMRPPGPGLIRFLQLIRFLEEQTGQRFGHDLLRWLCQVNSPRGTMPGCTFDDPATFGIAFRLKSSATPSGCITDTA